MASEANGYGYKGRRPAGRSIVEERSNNCKLTVWAQDLRPETLYSIFMLFADGERYAGIGMGALPIDEKGKGEVRREFNREELDMFRLSEIVAVAVIAKDAAGVICPLCGYNGETVSWRHKFYEYTRADTAFLQEDVPLQASELQAETCVPQISAERQGVVAENVSPSAAAMPMSETVHVMETASISETVAEAVPHMAETLPEIDVTPIVETAPVMKTISTPEVPPADNNHTALRPPPLSPEEWSEPPANQQGEPSPHTPEDENVSPYTCPNECEEPTQPYDPTPIRQFTHPAPPKSEIAKSFRVALDQLHADTIQRSAQVPKHSNLEEMFITREHVTPFQKQARKTNWIRFDLSDPVPPPTNRPHLFKDPFIQAAIAEHGHLILGMTVGPGPKQYIIGVPNNPCHESRQKARRLGFTQFKHRDELHPAKSDLGYWLMFITA